MSNIFVTIGKEKTMLDKQVFRELFKNTPHVKEYVAYRDAEKNNSITFRDLKELANRADVPFPLFFAPLKFVEEQLNDFKDCIEDKLPEKTEITLTSRGKLQIQDVLLIVKDLGRKQEFLKKYVLDTASENTYLGSLIKDVKQGILNDALALRVRDYFEIDLEELRKMSKERGLEYICKKAEEKGILISLSSNNYMPQNLKREIEISGLCVKDRIFPFVFINTRDGDEDPLILESAGRQIFTLVSMLVCIGMGVFALSMKKGVIKNAPQKKIFSIAGEILIPKADFSAISIDSLDQVKRIANNFKVTPSMLLFRLVEIGLLDKKTARSYREELTIALVKEKITPKRAPLPVNGYKKYNGERFSREILGAHRSKKISSEQARNILFRKGKKMDRSLFQEYANKFS